MSEEFDFESIKNKAIEQLKAGKPLLEEGGAFTPLLESFLNAALEGGMDAHLSEDERMSGNRRNGRMQKQVQMSMGEVTVSTPRDCNTTFDPQFIRKRGDNDSRGQEPRQTTTACASIRARTPVRS